MTEALAIVGSGKWPAAQLLTIARQEIIVYIVMHQPDLIVSGDAAGIDSVAKELAGEMGIPYEGHPPTTRRWDAPGGFRERNTKIAKRCTRLLSVRYVKAQTFGSGWTANEAERRRKPVDRWLIHDDGKIEEKAHGSDAWVVRIPGSL